MSPISALLLAVAVASQPLGAEASAAVRGLDDKSGADVGAAASGEASEPAAAEAVVPIPASLRGAVGVNATDVVASMGAACVGQTGWDTDFADNMYDCGLKSWGQAKKATECMTEKQHVSPQCGACLGELIHCGVGCAGDCCGGRCRESDECTRCNRDKCAPGFTECAGVVAP